MTKIEDVFKAAGNLVAYLNTLDDGDLALLAAGDEDALEAIVVWATMVRNHRHQMKLMEN